MVNEEYRNGVHEHHCCEQHGCKYGNDDCPVYRGNLKQKYLCEFCDDPNIIVNKKYFKQLQQDAEFLGCLLDVGVDNWDGYGQAIAQYRKIYGGEPNV